MTPLERRRALITALRQEMPTGFKWNFIKILRARSCGSVGCALGLAQHLGIIDNANDIDAKISNDFDMNQDQISAVFYNFMQFYPVTNSNVTPAMVADALEAL